MTFIDFLKRMPIDLGQGETNKRLRNKTYGKIIAESLVPPGKNKKALDVGCREGIQTEWLKNKGYEVTSIDIEKTYHNCQIVDVNNGLPFEKKSFDIVWCSEVIEHLENPKESIDEFKRVLKDGGKIILTTPNSFFWLYKIAKLFGKTAKDLQNKTHRHFFSQESILELEPNSKIKGYFPYMFKKVTIRKAINILSPTFIIELSKK